MPYYSNNASQQDIMAMLAARLQGRRGMGGGGRVSSGIPTSAEQMAEYTGMEEFATLQRGGNLTPSQIASMIARREANEAREEKRIDLGDFSATPLLNGTDEELARSQYARAGADAGVLMERPGARPELVGGRMDFSKVKPFKSAEDILSNPVFRQLVQRDPAKASKLYAAFTGKDFGAEYKEQEKQKLAVSSNYKEGIQRGFISGDLRRNPAMGWLERRRMVKDATGMNTVESWEPADDVLQQADRHYGQEATEYARPGMAAVLDDIAPHARNTFMQEFSNQKAAGKTDREAFVAANSAAETVALTPAQLATLQKAPAGAAPVSAPHSIPPAAAYPEKGAVDAIMQAGQTTNDWLWNNAVKGGINTGISALNIGTGLLNVPNKLANFGGALMGQENRVVGEIPYYPFVEDTNAFMSDAGRVVDMATDKMGTVRDDLWNRFFSAPKQPDGSGFRRKPLRSGGRY